MKLFALAAAATAVSGFAAAPTATGDTSPPRYSISFFATPEGLPESYPQAISQTGITVGRVTQHGLDTTGARWANGESDAFVLTNGEIRALDAVAVNSDGLTVGVLRDGGGAGAWDAEGNFTPFPDGMTPVAVNDDGLVAASGYVGASQRGFVLDSSSASPLRLPAAASEAWPHDIAENRVVVGEAKVMRPDNSGQDNVPVFWDGKGGVKLLQAPPGSSARANAVSPSGEFVGGESWVGDKPSQPVLWREGGPPKMLPLLTTHQERGTVTSVRNDGVAVGYVAPPGVYPSAALWDENGVHKLDDLVSLSENHRLVLATDINERGQIIGFAETPQGQRGYLLTPLTPPTVTVQPPAETRIVFGDGAAISAAASGHDPARIRWEHSGGGDAWQPIAGADSSELTIERGDTALNGHQVRAVFANQIGETATDSTLIAIDPAPTQLDAELSSESVSATQTLTVRGTVTATDILAPSGAVELVVAGKTIATGNVIASETAAEGWYELTADGGELNRLGETALTIRYVGDRYHQSASIQRAIGLDSSASGSQAGPDDATVTAAAATEPAAAGGLAATGAMLSGAGGLALLTLAALAAGSILRMRKLPTSAAPRT